MSQTFNSTAEATAKIDQWIVKIMCEPFDKIELVELLNQLKKFINNQSSSTTTTAPKSESNNETSKANRKALVQKFLELSADQIVVLLDQQHLAEGMGIKIESLSHKNYFADLLFRIESSMDSIGCSCIQTPEDAQFHLITKMKPPKFTTDPIVIDRKKQTDGYRKEFANLLQYMAKDVGDSAKPCGLVVGEEFVIAVPQDSIKLMSFVDSVNQMERLLKDVIHVAPDYEKGSIFLSTMVPGQLIAFMVNPCSIGPIFVVSSN